MDLIDRLRANLQSAGIPATAADFAGIEAKGFLSRVADVEQLLAELATDTLPDYLDAASLPAPAPAKYAAGTAGGDADTISGIAAQIASLQISPVELTKQVLEAIARHDPGLNAFQMLFADQALADAQAAEQAIQAGNYRGPLHGVPVAVKDLLDVEGIITSAGSKILADNLAAQDATGVAKLRAAGAIIVGKTRMSEFAYSPGSNNAHYGSTKNPFHPEHDAGGSSSGSGAAVAKGLVFAALGSDTGGSIRIPGAHCGIVGLKPTHGRASLAGAVTLSWSLDHLGPLTRSVADAALVLEAIAGPDPRDGRTLRPAPAFRAPDLAGGAAGLRVALLGDDGTGKPLASAEILARLRQSAAALADAGAHVSELDIPEVESLRLINPVILALEAAAFHIPHLRSRLDDYGEFMRQRILSSFVYGPTALISAQQARAALRRRMAEIFTQIDILLLPAVPDLAPALGIPTPTTFTGLFNCLGWPAVSVPVGLSAQGLPLSAQLVARPWEEATLLRTASSLEQAFGRLTPP